MGLCLFSLPRLCPLNPGLDAIAISDSTLGPLAMVKVSQIDVSVQEICPFQDNFDGIPGPEGDPLVATSKGKLGVAVEIEVILEMAHMDHSLDEAAVESNKEAMITDGADDAAESLSDSPTEP